jgi:hypothetical protein
VICFGILAISPVWSFDWSGKISSPVLGRLRKAVTSISEEEVPDATRTTTAPARALSQQVKDGRFFLVMAIASALLVFLGFARS